VVTHLRSAVRPYDALGRYGGEEFLVVLPNCDAPAALAIAERMRQRVGAARFASAAGWVRATLSLGVATSGVPRALDRDGLIEAADRALYQAKANGRNRAAAAG
jgi:diguanylate cyclase (GGDEF)-like protein